MQDLIAKIVAETGLAPGKAEKSVGILLSLLATQGDKAKVVELFAVLPSAEALANIQSGGLMGMMAGGMMGGPLVMFTKLQGLGLSMEQVKSVAALTLQHATSVAGIEKVRAAAANIPGISGYL